MPSVFEPNCDIALDLHTGTDLEFVGGAAIADFIAAAVERFDFFVFAVLNHVIDRIDIAAGHAAGRMYICELRHDDETGAFSQAFGLYRDDYQRSPDGWRFARRRYTTIGRHDGAAFSAFPLPFA
jgi:hypothetical protein